MAKMKPLYDFPANVPKKLIRAYINVGRNGRKLSKQIGVNDYYVSQALRGIEPTNKEMRIKLFFPPKQRKPHTKPRRVLTPKDRREIAERRSYSKGASTMVYKFKMEIMKWLKLP